MDFTSEQITILTVVISSSVTILAAIIAASVTIRTNSKARTHEQKLAILKILLESAYKEYEFRTKTEIETDEKKGRESQIKSFTEYIVFYRELSTLFSQETVNETDLINSLKKNKKLIDTYYEHREIERPEYHNKH